MFKGDPDFINEEGTKWWKYIVPAHPKLPDSSIWKVELSDGYETFVLINGEDIIDECQQLEGIGVKSDILAFYLTGIDSRTE